MAHEFQLIVAGELKTYTKWEDIPDKFDHLIKFLPDCKCAPHELTPEEQPEDGGEFDTLFWKGRLMELRDREKANASSV